MICFFSAIYIFERNKQGINLSANTRVNTVNKNAYKYGNKYDISSFYFVKRSFKALDYMPFVGLSAELISKDYSHNYVREKSGGKAVYTQFGAQFLIRNRWSFYVKGDIPLAQNYLNLEGNITTQARAQVQFNYLFSKKQTFKITNNEN
ncbi:MAG: hypothetical protein LRY27_00875 [Chitinophagales bacterium]|nr:hypothetical protein [Chitinophagales bacterium]